MNNQSLPVLGVDLFWYFCMNFEHPPKLISIDGGIISVGLKMLLIVTDFGILQFTQ